MKAVALVCLWIVGTAAAVAVASAGVAVVNDEIIDPAPAVIASSASPIGSIPIADDPEVAIGDAGPDAPTDDTTEDEPDPTNSTTTSPPTSTEPTPDLVAPATPSTTTKTTSTTPAIPTTTVPAATTTTSSPAPTPDTLTFQLVGGTTAISFSPSGVDVLWASPNPGFDVKIEPESPGLKVEFRSDAHRSRVDVWWDGGPRHEIREEPND